MMWVQSINRFPPRNRDQLLCGQPCPSGDDDDETVHWLADGGQKEVKEGARDLWTPTPLNDGKLVNNERRPATAQGEFWLDGKYLRSPRRIKSELVCCCGNAKFVYTRLFCKFLDRASE
jgi:hypothetical protein